ncbi:MAG: AraC family transcriptional regulator [Anaerobutyricum sp.]|nr:AraC family transcriptional regulator [Anaerobutyricum sp.]
MDYINIMKDLYQYLSGPEKKCDSLVELAGRYTYEPHYFGWLFCSFFSIPFDQLKEKAGHYKIEEDRIPFERIINDSCIEKCHLKRKKLVLTGKCMEIPTGQEEKTYKRTADVFFKYQQTNSGKKFKEDKIERIALWIRDDKYHFRYFVGTETDGEQLRKGQLRVVLPESDYMVWRVNQNEMADLAESCKMLVKKRYSSQPENGYFFRKDSYPFLAYDGCTLSLYMPVEADKKGKTKTYHLDAWIDYINDHIRDNLTVEGLASEFGYSVQHFRHIFSLYYGMTASDYIRKKRLQLISESIQKGKDVSAAAQEYGFQSYQGVARAFEKEFHIPLSQYKKAEFLVVDLNRYYSMYKEQLQVSFMEINEFSAVCHTVIPDIQEEVDLPAQINYWLHREFPCVKNKRLNYNREKKEDKIALWHSVEKQRGDLTEIYYEYVLGPIVDHTDEIEGEGLYMIRIEGGSYAVFQTERESDRENMEDTIRMFARCVYFGWIQENMEKVDFNRYTFERYLNDKIFVYVPVHSLKKKGEENL